MTAKQLPGKLAPDGSTYCTVTDGNGNLLTKHTQSLGKASTLISSKTSDGSTNITLTDGNGNLV